MQLILNLPGGQVDIQLERTDKRIRLYGRYNQSYSHDKGGGVRADNRLPSDLRPFLGLFFGFFGAGNEPALWCDRLTRRLLPCRTVKITSRLIASEWGDVDFRGAGSQEVVKNKQFSRPKNGKSRWVDCRISASRCYRHCGSSGPLIHWHQVVGMHQT